MRPEHYHDSRIFDEATAQETPALALELASGFVDMGVLLWRESSAAPLVTAQ